MKCYKKSQIQTWPKLDLIEIIGKYNQLSLKSQALWLTQWVPGWDFIYDHESQVMQHLIEKCSSLLLLIEICTAQFRV